MMEKSICTQPRRLLFLYISALHFNNSTCSYWEQLFHHDLHLSMTTLSDCRFNESSFKDQQHSSQLTQLQALPYPIHSTPGFSTGQGRSTIQELNRVESKIRHPLVGMRDASGGLQPWKIRALHGKRRVKWCLLIFGVRSWMSLMRQ